MSPAKSVLLLVEDNALISAVTPEQLEAQGFEVVVAANASQAEQELSRRGEIFESVVLDVNLGSGPSGYDVALALRERWSDLPIVFTTGDAAGPLFAFHIGRAAHVGKPYTFQELLDALRLAGSGVAHIPLR